MLQRKLGNSHIKVSALGLGCWAIGGPFRGGEEQWGYGLVDDQESIRAIQAAVEHGVTFFDTAANYGAGHSERLLGEALIGLRDRVRISTKFGYRVFEDRKQVDGLQLDPEGIRRSCEESLKRLRTDRIDLFFLHVGDLPIPEAQDVQGVLETLVEEGLILSYGWSTDDPVRARSFDGRHMVAVQHQLNIFEDNPQMLALCTEMGWASINRGPLAMGLLTGKYREGAQFDPTDLRHRNHPWMHYFKDGQPNPQWLARLEQVREVLTSGGRTLTQGALAWIWGHSSLTVPIPGFKTVQQAIENAAALQFGPLTPAQMQQVDSLLKGETVASAH